MVAPGLGQYGSAGYASPESRALESINIESYSKVYNDQSAFLGKLASDVSYLAGYTRKMQRGIDQANQNFIQQMQSTINDVIVIMGGGSFGGSGIDFGDLKYVLQMFGALMGFESVGGIPLPINVVNAAWHFFSTYIFPADNFQQVINVIVDGVIATMLTFLGGVPIAGQAAEQVAAVISDIRDVLQPIAAAVDAFFAAFSINLNDPSQVSDYFGPLTAIFNALATALNGIHLPDFTPMFHELAQWSKPFVELIVEYIGLWTAVIDLLTGQPITGAALTLPFTLPGVLGDPTANPFFKFFNNFLTLFDINTWLSGSFNPVTAITNFVTNVLQPTGLLAWLDPISGLLPNGQAPQLLMDVITAIENAFESIPFVGPLIAQPIFNTINGLLGIGTGNSTRLTHVENTLASITLSGGVSISDSFDGTVASTIGSNYHSVGIGAGTGTWGLDGSGNAHWAGGTGGATRSWRERHVTPLTTNYQTVSVVQGTAFGPGDIAANGIRLQARMDSAETSWVECRIYRTGTIQCDMWAFYSGSYHQIGSSMPISTNDPATTWELRTGDISSGDRNFRLFRNGTLFTSWLESGTGSVMSNTTNIYCAHQVDQGLDIFSDAIGPPDIAIFAFADRTSAS